MTGEPSVCAGLVVTGKLGKTGEGSGFVEVLLAVDEVKERIVKGPTDEYTCVGSAELTIWRR